jgi:hypothetical protein
MLLGTVKGQARRAATNRVMGSCHAPQSRTDGCVQGHFCVSTVSFVGSLCPATAAMLDPLARVRHVTTFCEQAIPVSVG